MTKIEELKAAYEAATPGEWRIGDAGATVFGPKTDSPSPETVAGVRKKANAEFIALAHNMMPQLILAAAGAKEFVKQVADDAEDSEIEPELIKDGVFIAIFETRSFTFRAVGTTREEAVEALEGGLKRHSQQTEVDPSYLLDLIATDANVIHLLPGECMRDYEKV